ncbi:bile acid:sodium symporter family protein [Streptomyces sp. GD-15H]|uniref:bile acid:sodium symporter family protein n=1 Tax=Streptomyces sp. GD-15H TaxID=3129112 RepID=UPI0032446DF4
MRFVKGVGSGLTRYLPLWIVAGMAYAMWQPDSIAPYSAWTLYVVMLLMFIMGITLSVADLASIRRAPASVLIGVICQFTIMPLVAFGVANVLNLNDQLTIGLVILGSVAGGSASNVIVYLSKGDVPLSVAMTTVSTFVSILVTPLWIEVLADKLVPIPASSMALDIARMVVIPVVAGALLRTFAPRVCHAVEPVVAPLSAIALVFITASNLSSGHAAFMASGVLIFVAVLAHNVIGLALGYAGGKLTRRSTRQTRAISIEVGMQNGGIALVLAGTYFGAEAALPSTLVGSIGVLTGTILARYWSTRPATDVYAPLADNEPVAVPPESETSPS